MVCPIFAAFFTKTQNPSKMTVERQKFRILKIQDGGPDGFAPKRYERRSNSILLGAETYRVDHRGDKLVSDKFVVYGLCFRSVCLCVCYFVCYTELPYKIVLCTFLVEKYKKRAL